MNLYQASIGNRTIEVESDTSYHAQLAASKILKPKRDYDVCIMLLEIDGVPYVHSTSDI